MARARPKGSPGPRTSVLLVDDHEVVRKGIRTLLDLDPGIVVVGEAKDGRQAVEVAMRLDPDVVLMDIGMPNLNGIEATRQIRRAAPRSRVVILSAYGEELYVESVTAAGAAGFVLKQSSLAALARAIRETGKGGTFVDPGVRRPVPGSPARPGPRLSSREAEVLQLIAEGKPNAETAAALGISGKTVEKHRQRLMARLDIHDVAGLTRYAVKAGVVECRPGRRGS